ncbi:MAG: c-type cytochrome [Candidatus Omnitrophica bacterium]|nr:c-type cytochrome [Candidatus Omnitrophota bacterium]
MRNIILYGSFLLIAAAALVLFSDVRVLWGQEEPPISVSKGKAGRNLQILGIDSAIDLQDEMKFIMKSLGVDCKFCHILTDFSADVKELHKDKARDMMKMVDEINETFFKESKIQITCFTCHRGQKKPAMRFEDLKPPLEQSQKP